MDYELVDLIDIEELKELTDRFSKVIRTAMGIFDHNGKVLFGSGWYKVCTEYHRVHPITAERCRKSDLAMLDYTKKGHADYCLHKCENGLMDTSAPIIIEGRYLGGLSTGQFFLEPPNMDFFARQADEFGFDKGKYLQSVSEVPVFTKEHVDTFMGFYHRLANIIAETGYSKLQLQKLNKELEQHRDHLEDLVKEKTADLAKAKEAAEAANLAKSVFLANMSHELRTPLNAILGIGQLMIRDTGFPGKYKENLNILASSGEYLLCLIDDVLEISKIEVGRSNVVKSDISLFRTLETVEKIAQSQAEKKGLKFVVDRAPDVPEFVKTDGAKIQQILNNLIDNAIKYTEKGSVTVRLKSKQDSNLSSKTLVLEVEDTGIGINPENKAKIFENFSQIKDSEKSREGVGLGLTICSHYAELMGGTISVKSQAGKGAIFTVELPVEVVDKSEVTQISLTRRVIGLEPGQADFGILIAEDNPDSRSVLRQLLESAGFNVIEAANGQEAVEQYKNQSPDMIWMDIRLPVMSGVEATKRIRKLEEKSTIQNPKSKIDRLPIVALSASSFEEDREEFLAAGCDDFVRKPFRAEEIFNVMAKYMEVRYIYQDIQTPVEKPVTPALTSADMANLPADLCQQINTLAKGAMSKQLLNVFKQIPPDFRYVADALAAHVSQYQFARIITLTEKENKDD